MFFFFENINDVDICCSDFYLETINNITKYKFTNLSTNYQNFRQKISDCCTKGDSLFMKHFKYLLKINVC